MHVGAEPMTLLPPRLRVSMQGMFPIQAGSTVILLERKFSFSRRGMCYRGRCGWQQQREGCHHYGKIYYRIYRGIREGTWIQNAS